MKHEIPIAMRSPVSKSGSADILRSMDRCTKCGICHAHCPVAAVTETFPGPKYTGPQAQRFRAIEAGFEISPSLCSGCGVCTSVCPNNVAIADIITLEKGEISGKKRKNKLGQWLLNRPLMIGRLGGAFPSVSNFLLANRVIRIAADRLFGIHRNAPLPTFQGRQFSKWFKSYQQPEGIETVYFPGCTVDVYDPGVGISLVKLLNLVGHSVVIPENLCCSLPMLTNGEIESARIKARSLVNALHPLTAGDKPIISTSTSCSLALRSKYAAYLDMSDPQSEKVTSAVVDACEFLLQNHADKLRQSLINLPLKVLYHGPCQLRGHKMGEPAVELLQMVPGIQLEQSDADCCGIGGTYGYDKEKYGISISIGKKLVAQVNRQKPDIIACDSETCRWNIESQTGIQCLHPVEVLGRALKR